MKKDCIITIYTKKEGGKADVLKIDFFNKHYYEGRGAKEQDIDTTKMYEVNGELYDDMWRAIAKLYGGEVFSHGDIEEIDSAEENVRTVLSVELVRKALRCDLKDNDLKKVMSFDVDYEIADYYDFELFMKNLLAYKHGDLKESRFDSVCVVAMRCLYNYMPECDDKLKALYEDLADTFDCWAFGCHSDKQRECRHRIAVLKHTNHLIECAKNDVEKPFIKNGVVTNICVCCINTEEVYRVCVADTKRKAVNFMYVPNLDFDEDINYTFLSEAEFNSLSNKFYEYTFDPSMDQDYAKTK